MHSSHRKALTELWQRFFLEPVSRQGFVDQIVSTSPGQQEAPVVTLFSPAMPPRFCGVPGPRQFRKVPVFNQPVAADLVVCRLEVVSLRLKLVLIHNHR